jgi:hypothetical protein
MVDEVLLDEGVGWSTIARGDWLGATVAWGLWGWPRAVIGASRGVKPH